MESTPTPGNGNLKYVPVSLLKQIPELNDPINTVEIALRTWANQRFLEILQQFWDEEKVLRGFKEKKDKILQDLGERIKDLSSINHVSHTQAKKLKSFDVEAFSFLLERYVKEGHVGPAEEKRFLGKKGLELGSLQNQIRKRITSLKKSMIGASQFQASQSQFTSGSTTPSSATENAIGEDVFDAAAESIFSITKDQVITTNVDLGGDECGNFKSFIETPNSTPKTETESYTHHEKPSIEFFKDADVFKNMAQVMNEFGEKTEDAIKKSLLRAQNLQKYIEEIETKAERYSQKKLALEQENLNLEIEIQKLISVETGGKEIFESIIASTSSFEILTQFDNNISDIKQTIEERVFSLNQAQEEGIVCSQCRKNDRNVVYQPCKHMCLCEKCDKGSTECLQCHQKIESRDRKSVV